MSESLPHGAGGSNLLAGEERRRSQRVVIRVPVTLHCLVGGKNIKVQATTVSVNDHGAMVLSAHSLAANATFELENDRTHEKVNCRVTRAPVETAEGFMIPAEFASAAPDFWRISFPPTNWKPVEE